MRGWLFLWTAALTTAFAPYSLACSTFALKSQDGPVIGKSYDWHQPHGRVLINPRNVTKSSLVLRPGDAPARWTSRLGSVTFNQHGQDLPLGGMNEAGLVVEIMWLDSSVYPGSDSRQTFNELQWIQYQLDNYATTAEVVKAAPTFRVSPILAKVHYLVCDLGRDCATFEYVGGQLVIHHGKDLPVPVLTNNSYADSSTHLKKFVGFGGNLPLPTDESSLSRFVRASSRVQQFPGGNVNTARTYGFETLNQVRMQHTKFQIIYSPERRIDFRTAAFQGIRYMELADHSFSCLDKVRYLDANDALTGDLKHKFMVFGATENLTLVREGMKGFENQLPAGIDFKVGAYPQTFVCGE